MLPDEEVIDNAANDTSSTTGQLYVAALTTSFTPRASCLAPSFTMAPEGSDFTNTGTFRAVIRGVDPSCYPQNFYGIQGDESTLVPYFSPGFCPAGYVTISQNTNTGATDTTATCCPSGMWISTQDTHLVPLPGSLSTYCTGGTSLSNHTWYASTVTLVNQDTTTTFLPFASYAVPLVVRFAASDELSWAQAPQTTMSPSDVTTSPGYTMDSSTTPAIPNYPKTIKTTTTATSNPNAPNTNPYELRPAGLTTGAKAGIGVGAAAAVVGAIAVGYLCLMRRRNRRAASPSLSMPFATYDNMSKVGASASASSNLPNSAGSPFSPSSQYLSGVQPNELQVPKKPSAT